MLAELSDLIQNSVCHHYLKFLITALLVSRSVDYYKYHYIKIQIRTFGHF